MKYCLSSRQSEQYLLQADQIHVNFRDRKITPDLIKEYPNKEIILGFPVAKEKDFDWKEIEEYNILSQDNLICCLREGSDIWECKKHNITHYYYGYPLGSFYDLKALAAVGVCYLVVDMPAFFRLDLVKKLGVPVRATPNVAHYEYIPHQDGVCGRWIRPEDVELYSEYIEVLEFENADVKKEATLFNIYAQDHEWLGDLNDLITNLNYPRSVKNNLIYSDCAVARLTCGQKCQENGHCNICRRAFGLANKENLLNHKNFFEKL